MPQGRETSLSHNGGGGCEGGEPVDVRPARWFTMSAAGVAVTAALTVAVVFALATFVQVEHPFLTPEFLEYQQARSTRQQADPQYEPRPFVGRRFGHYSPWHFASTYIALLATGTAMAAAAVIVRRRAGAR